MSYPKQIQTQVIIILAHETQYSNSSYKIFRIFLYYDTYF